MKNVYLLVKSTFVLVGMSLSAFVWGQAATLSGTITDPRGETLPGVTVLIDGTGQGTISDIDGVYNLAFEAPGTYVITYTYIGFKKITETVTLASGQNMKKDLAMEEDALMLETAIVVGYGTVKSKDLTGSITNVGVKDFQTGNVTTPEQLIVGKVSGVQITSNSGMPGAGSRIRIRGGTSLNASNDPLIVIDGVPIDNNGISGSGNALSLINPDDIENITILKDASAAAIYGSRAANGVIIVTTKKGFSDSKLHIDVSTTESFATVTQTVDVLTADELRDVINTNGTATQQALLGTENTDWQSELYRLGIVTDNDITFYGGVKNLPYRLNLEYMMEQGVLDRSQLNRMGASLALNPSYFNGKLKTDANGKFFHTDNFFADQGSIGTAITFDPTKPVYDAASIYGGYYEWQNAAGLISLAPKNPVGLLNQRDDESNVNRFIGNIKLDFELMKDLHGVVNGGLDMSRSAGTIVVPEEAASSFSNGGVNNQYEQSKDNRLLEAYLNYKKDVNSIKSKIDFTAGYSYQFWTRKEPAFASLNFAGDTITPAGIPTETENALISFYGRLNYTLNSKYLLTATIREDGSSRFSPENRWGLFPSVAVAWLVSDEKFMSDSKMYLKFRAGFGVTGQQDIFNDYPYIANYDSSTSTAQYQFGDVFYYLLRPDGYDPNIKWEETSSYNVGIDFGFAGDKVSGSLDVYKKITDDLLATISIPAGTNFTNKILTNVGSMENMGVEANINIVAINKKDMNLEFGINGTVNKNEITNLTKVADPNSPGILVGDIDGGIGNKVQIQAVGYSANTFYMYEQVYDEDGNPIEGEYVDQNNDSIINADDLIQGKSPTPDFYAGFYTSFRYKKWSVGFSLRGEFGKYMYNNISSTRGVYQNIPASSYMQNLSTNYLETEFQTYQLLSDYYIENASFVRMDNFSVGYDVGKVFNDNASLTVSAIVQNVFVISPYSGLDPEIATGIDKTIYPRPRIYSISANLKL
ncbi:MAG: SusC/RagA family TonB-linked outer membrane protein [Bacteroidetes bacterium]|nr:SusC/RagA family TonB-linked outer membrane protein [Bacteroidota bacterium]